MIKKEGEKADRYILDFDIKPGEELLAKVAMSTVSVDGAKENLAMENPGWDFNKIKVNAENAWEELLSRVKVKGTKAQKNNFYSSLYHLYIQPNDITDVSGNYRNFNDSIVRAKGDVYFSTLSLWDTFRAAHPLYTIYTPELVDHFVNSMLDHFDDAGILPIWTLWGKETNTMIGNHSIPVIADAYLKGFTGFDAERAFNAVKISSTKDHFKSEWSIYDKYGYFPYDLILEESVSKTLEMGIDDYGVAVMAKGLGKTDDYDFFLKRSKNYKNLYDPSVQLMRGKNSQGEWRPDFDKLAISHAGTAGGDYTEGNAWQYTFHVLQDVDGLAKLMGGNDKLASRLDSLFLLAPVKKSSGFDGDVSGLIGQYAHGNEPSHHVVYLYTLLGKPWKTQELVREICDKFYLNKPDGLCGNDDCGQMSAWYLFSVMGFYPVNPIGGEYVLGAPQLPEVKLSLPGDKVFTVKTENFSKNNKYVKGVKLNGKEYKSNSIFHKDIMNGGELVFTMTDTPLQK